MRIFSKFGNSVLLSFPHSPTQASEYKSKQANKKTPGHDLASEPSRFWGSTGTGDSATAPLTAQRRGLAASTPNSGIRGAHREPRKLNSPGKAVPLAGTHMHTRAGRDPELP